MTASNAAAGSGQNAMAQMLLQAMGVNANQSAQNTSASNGNSSSVADGQVPNNLMQQMAAMMQDQQRAAMEEMKREPDLEDILDPNANKEILALLDDEKVVEELAQHLPESMRSREDMIEQIQSPQFQGALRRLQRAVNGPQMPTLLQQMGINGRNQNAMGVTAFVNAIQPEDANEKDDDGDTAMKDDENDKQKDKDKDLYK